MSDDNLDFGGVFPYLDAVEPVGAAGTPPGFDLVQILSESMRSRPPWMSMAQVSSNVLYQYIEQNRIALELSRTPENISRVLKISTLKMMGIDWISDYVSDDAYDRLLNTVSLYLLNHGTADFVNYIGYALGFKMSMETLWTQDYQLFVPGPQADSIFNSPPGPWYPTSHVGFLYEQYATNAPDADDISAFQNIFYQIAPIHLVLEFIGTVVTLTVGPLLLEAAVYERSIDTIIAEYVPQTTLYYSVVPYEKSVDIAICEPLYPSREIDDNISVYGIDYGSDYASIYSNGIAWGAGMPLLYSGITPTGGYEVIGAQNFDIAEEQPSNWNDSYGNFGLLVQKQIILLLSSSGDPLYSNWFPSGVSINSTYTKYDGTPGYTIVGNKGGCILSSPTPTGIDCVLFSFRATDNSGNIVIVRGSDALVINGNNHTVSASGPTQFGIYRVGGEFYTAWAVMTGSAIAIYPGGIGNGSFDWLDVQIIQGVNYPAPITATVPSQNSYVLNPGTYSYIGSLLSQIFYGSNIDLGQVYSLALYGADLGSIINPPALSYDLGSVTQASTAPIVVNPQIFDFYNGIAEVYPGTPAPPTNSIQTAFAGTTISLNVNYLNNSDCGEIILSLKNLFGEYVTSTLPILEVVDNNGDGLYISVASTGITAIVYGDSYTFSIPDGFIRISVLWANSTTIVTVNGQTNTFTPILSNLVSVELFGGNLATATWLIETLVVQCATLSSQLLSSALLQTYTGGPYYILGLSNNLDLGNLVSTPTLKSDLGKISTTNTSSLSLGTV